MGSSKDGSKSGKQKSQKKRTMAAQADKFLCYQKSVQSPDHEVDFFEQAYHDAFGKKPNTLREDFCGTFAVCCEWVKSSARRTAIGVDLCSETLQWGRDNNLAKLTEAQQGRVRLLEQDVRKRNRPQVDVLAAQNFSFWIFKTRKEVVDYFRAARANMASQSVMVMDMMGGGDCYVEGQTDKRTIKKGKKGFKYHWKQVSFNPINHDASFSISFKFKDGSKLTDAFEYHWRFWSIPEVCEMIEEAGFSESHIYWEKEDGSGDETDEWEKRQIAESAACWIAYIVAVK
jgi:predicted RNA methylase